jgi:coenzyme F420 hydrogenase subunit beta
MEEQEEVKTFTDLRREVVDRNMCGKCGGCYSFCSAGKLNALEMGDNNLPAYCDEDKCLKCGICYLICPQINVLNDELKARFGWKPPIGAYQRISSARTTDQKVRPVCTDGGVVTSLLLHLLDQSLIEGAIVSKKKGPFAREPIIARTRDDIIAAAGSQFAESFHLEELGGKYSTYSPILPEVKRLEHKYLRNIAVVGTPCQINTIKKMQCLGILPAHMVAYTIGLFCIENFAFNDLVRKRLEKRLDMDLVDIQKLNIKDDLIITLSTGTMIRIPLEKVDMAARPACLTCSDFANEYADISVGGLGSLDGYTTTIIRTEKGATLFRNALSQGYIEEAAYRNAGERKIEKTKMRAKIVSFSTRKRLRAEERLRNIGGVEKVGSQE